MCSKTCLELMKLQELIRNKVTILAALASRLNRNTPKVREVYIKTISRLADEIELSLKSFELKRKEDGK